jgi:hypothetical protein
LVRNPNPISTPARISQRSARGLSKARTTAYPAAVSSSTSRASGLSNRNIAAATGVSAIASPAKSAGPGRLTVRRTAATTKATVTTPISACGNSSAQLLNPNSRMDRPMTHNEAGGLSTVMLLPASSEPKNHAFQLCDPACAAAA